MLMSQTGSVDPARDTAVDAKSFTFLLIPDFSMMAFTAAVEPLRSANRMSGVDHYRWTIVSGDGSPVQASNGLEVVAHHAISDVPECDTLFVCSGIDAHVYNDRSIMAWLRKLARQGTVMGSLCTGTHILARAGLIRGHRCTIHWEDYDSFAEDHSELDVTDDLFEIDRNRITCSGGTAALDLMLHLITLDHGAELAGRVSEQFIHERIREPHDQQRMALQSRTGVNDAKVLAAIGEMEANLEEPLTIPEIAAGVDLSTRQLERLFIRHLGRSPSRYYRELRLHHARLMLMQGSTSILSIALAAGFVSASHFSRRYRELFGRPPREERRSAA